MSDDKNNGTPVPNPESTAQSSSPTNSEPPVPIAPDTNPGSVQISETDHTRPHHGAIINDIPTPRAPDTNPGSVSVIRTGNDTPEKKSGD